MRDSLIHNGEYLGCLGMVAILAAFVAASYVMWRVL